MECFCCHGNDAQHEMEYLLVQPALPRDVSRSVPAIASTPALRGVHATRRGSAGANEWGGSKTMKVYVQRPCSKCEAGASMSLLKTDNPTKPASVCALVKD